MTSQTEYRTNSGKTLSERVYQSVRGAILSLDLAPGSRIDKKAMAKELGVSLFPLSEAISRLSQEGIVNVYPQAGTYVAPFSMLEIREGAFLRLAMEVAAVELVAQTATDTQISELRRNLRIQEVLAEDGDCDGFFRLDDEMHNFLRRATGHFKIQWVIETTGLQADRARRLIARTPGRVQIALEEHRIIVEGIEEHDSEKAGSGMKSHLKRVARDFEKLEASRPELFVSAQPGSWRKK